jgi:hypothetical protein
MPLDPIVSLSVAIAEAPGSYAFFLGSGVSRDAGVPTGSEVFWLAVGELYRLENTSEETPDDEGLRAWLEETERGDIKYSDVLELIAPDAATRRDYLAKHFAGVEPGPTHERLADLAARGLVKVFITTNFDRLLEHALQARGLEPVVVTSADDLGRAPRREHAQCYVLKPHGDYLQQTIRNTPAELAELETDIATELQEVFDRYGLVILGYSGADEAIANALRARRSRYGLYWVARNEPTEPASGLIEAAAGRVIVREGAADFLADLNRRLAVFQAQPSGLTPLLVNDEVIALLRRGDRVGLGELLRSERREFKERFDELVDGRGRDYPEPEVIRAVEGELLPVMERRLASLLPLVLYDEELYAQEVGDLVDFVNAQKVGSGYAFWFELSRWVVWWLAFALGGFALLHRQWTALGGLLMADVQDQYGGTESLVQSVPPGTTQDMVEAVMAEAGERKWTSPAWQGLVYRLGELELLRERYPEMVSPAERLRRHLVEFDFVRNIAVGVREPGGVAHWTIFRGEAEDLARRLHRDERFRADLAQAFGLTLEEFDERAPAALRASHGLGNFPDRDAVTILEKGTRQ